MMSKYEQIREIFESHADPENADSMKKYMRDQFEFYGLAADKRRNLYRDFLKEEKKSKTIDWEFLDACWQDEHREFQYLACSYLERMVKFLTYDDITHILEYVRTKSWWDTIDFLCKVIGKIGESDPRVDDLMITWAADNDFWVRRTAIEHQLGRKEKTNVELLEKILTVNFGSNEFFINKAIGWALRDYSKTNPEWVAAFIEKYRDQMSGLSIREGSKYI